MYACKRRLVEARRDRKRVREEWARGGGGDMMPPSSAVHLIPKPTTLPKSHKFDLSGSVVAN